MGAVRTAARAAAGLASLALAAGIVASGAGPAQAVPVFVEVNPSTVQAGSQVSIRASCNDNVNPAVVQSDAFGQVTVTPQGGFLTGMATIPPTRRPREYRVRLTCSDGATATTTLVVLAAGTPTRGPATGGGGTAGATGGFMIAGGVAALGIAAGLGLLARHRRRADRLV
jgi:hypothetical protein